jgi:hypothetical protein
MEDVLASSREVLVATAAVIIPVRPEDRCCNVKSVQVVDGE